jgi:hypothetical protein
MNDSMPENDTTIEELRDLVNEAVWLIELGGTEQERAEFRRRKDDLLARLVPTGDES